jgi:hypothetical protein
VYRRHQRQLEIVFIVSSTAAGDDYDVLPLPVADSLPPGRHLPIDNMPDAIQPYTYVILCGISVILHRIVLKGIGLDTFWPEALRSSKRRAQASASFNDAAPAGTRMRRS